MIFSTSIHGRGLLLLKAVCCSSSQFSAQAVRHIFVKSLFKALRLSASCSGLPSPSSSPWPALVDGLRDKYQIQECTKRDVCLLMRQLDAYFYTRARQGKLVSYDSPPQRSWVLDGRCEKNARSIKMAPVTKLPACKAAVCAKGIQKVKVVNSTTLPTGCSSKTQRTSKAYLNKLETKVEAGSTYSQGQHWSQTNKKRDRPVLRGGSLLERGSRILLLALQA